ncbi:MAG TPA: hypothetical protein VF591_16935 [Pyrinomonadaceae bacterium]|jgi:hypothetical protein
MLFFVVAWLPLLLVCWLCGAAVLERAAGAGAFRRAGDRLILSLWLGLVVLAQALLAAALFAPLTPLSGAAVAAALSGVALLSRGVRAEAARLKGLLRRPGLPLGLLALAAGVASFASQPVTYFDTGLYHFQNVRWLAEHGAVPGLALLHIRFAFASAWFALAAPFEAGPFEARAAAVACGFGLLVASLHALVCAGRCAAGAGRAPDWLAVLSYAFVLPPALFWRQPASASPDLPIFFLAVAVAWAACLIEEEREDSRARLLPVLLAAGAVGAKLSGLALLVVASLYYVRGVGLSPRRLLSAGALVAVMLLPTLAYGVVTSGCPLFPAQVLCVRVPWSVREGEAAHLTRVIRDWARWDGSSPPGANGWNWIVPWATKGFTLKNSPVPLLCVLVACGGAFARAKTRLRAQGTLALLAGSAGLLLFLQWRGPGLLMVGVAAAGAVAALTRRGGQFAGRAWVLAAGLAGTALTLYAGPALRFGLGYTAILFAALLVPAAVGFKVDAGVADVWRRRATLAALTTACGLAFFTLTLALEAGTRVGAGVEGRFRRLLVPPPLPEASTAPREVNGLRYSVPAEWEQCWAAELPCAPRDLPPEVTLRDPARGPGGGFVRAAPNR